MSQCIKDPSDSPFIKDIVTYQVGPHLIDELYHNGCIVIPPTMQVYPNQGVVLRSGQQSALGLVSKDGRQIIKVDGETQYYGIKGKNKEQKILLQILSDPAIRCVVVTGAAGTGKTLVTGAWALSQILGPEPRYEQLLLSKPLEIVGNSKYWGTLPGDSEDKYKPYLLSYMIMFQNLISKNGVSYVESMVKKGIIKYMPLELMRGASFQSSIVWSDESQSYGDVLGALGSRLDDVGESKLIISGDFNQRDRYIKKNLTGMWKLTSSPYFARSPHTAHVHLRKIERGEIAELFVNIFDETGKD